MRKQIGWYDPESQNFCYGYQKDDYPAKYDKYAVPVLADDGGVDPQVSLQVLRNQLFVMGQLDEIGRDVRSHSYETGFGQTAYHAIAYDELRKRTEDLLEKEDHGCEDHGHKS